MEKRLTQTKIDHNESADRVAADMNSNEAIRFRLDGLKVNWAQERKLKK